MASGIETEAEGGVKGAYQEARDIGADIADIASDLRDLAQKEVDLARTEVREQVMLLWRSVALGAMVAVETLLLLTFLLLGAMFALDIVLDLWAAALITAGFVAVLALINGIVAYLLLKRFHLVPRRTVKTIREDFEWGLNRLKSNVR